MIYDRITQQPTACKLVKGIINSMEYGPYDNGHIVVGTSYGNLIIFDSINLTKILHYSMFYCGISSITFDPT